MCNEFFRLMLQKQTQSLSTFPPKINISLPVHYKILILPFFYQKLHFSVIYLNIFHKHLAAWLLGNQFLNPEILNN